MLWEKRERVCVWVRACARVRRGGKPLFWLANDSAIYKKKDAATEEQRGEAVEASGGQWGNQRGFSHSVARKYSYLQHSYVS